jgi:hypothetical protein
LFPWATLGLMLFRFLSPRGATVLINGLDVILLVLLIKRFRGNMLLTIPVVISPFGNAFLINGQTDVLVLETASLRACFLG